MFGSKRRKNIRDLNRVAWNHAISIELLELKVSAIEAKLVEKDGQATG